MNQLLKMTYAFAFCMCTLVLNGQEAPYQEIYASNDFTAAKKITNARVITSQNIFTAETLVSEAFLDAKNGFIGIVFSEQVVKPNIYYKIVDKAGKEVYNGSAHAILGSQPTLYYNTKNLPTGEYRIFVENDDFFLSTSFIK